MGVSAALLELSQILPRLPEIIGDAWPTWDGRLAPLFRALVAASDEGERSRAARGFLNPLFEYAEIRDRLAPSLAPGPIGTDFDRDDFERGHLDFDPTVDPPWSTIMFHLRRAAPDHWSADVDPDRSFEDLAVGHYYDDGALPPADGPEPETSTKRDLRASFVDDPGRAPEAAPPGPGEDGFIRFQVGGAGPRNLLTGDVSVDADDIPRQGLRTTWVVRSVDVRLRSLRARRSSSRVSFTLRIPRSGSSPAVYIIATPLAEGPARIDVSVYVGTELYRECSIGFVAGGGGTDGPTHAMTDREWIPTAHTRLHTGHEWTTPPGRLNITVRDRDRELEWVQEWGTNRRQLFPVWNVNSDLKGQIGNVRRALELFREQHTDYLDDIDPADVTARLAGAPDNYLHYLFPGSSPPDQADATHHAAWDEVAASDELFQLAYDGYLLARDLFGAAVMARLAALDPGYRVTVTWRNPSIQSLPWGLLYLTEPQPGQPLDPYSFVGLRFRFSYTGYSAEETRKDLGGVDEAYRAFLLYWGDDAADEVALEARWQQEQLRPAANTVVLPPPALTAGDASNAKRAIVQYLAQPTPSPAAVLYLFCHCTVDAGFNPVLRFGSVSAPDYLLNSYDLALQTRLADQPLVFANACATSGAEPDVGNLLEIGFFGRGCRGFVGTETQVPIRLASRFARVVFAFLLREFDDRPMCAGEAVFHARQFLWTQYRNIGGLFYSYVNEYELFLATEQEVQSLRGW